MINNIKSIYKYTTPVAKATTATGLAVGGVTAVGLTAGVSLAATPIFAAGGALVGAASGLIYEAGVIVKVAKRAPKISEVWNKLWCKPENAANNNQAENKSFAKKLYKHSKPIAKFAVGFGLAVAGITALATATAVAIAAAPILATGGAIYGAGAGLLFEGCAIVKVAKKAKKIPEVWNSLWTKPEYNAV